MSTRINRIFKAIADPTRREIFHVLVFAGSTLTITQLSSHFEMTRQGVSKHIRILEEAGLIDVHPEGRERICQANTIPIREIRNWATTYERFWEEKLLSLQKHLAQKPPQTT